MGVGGEASRLWIPTSTQASQGLRNVLSGLLSFKVPASNRIVTHRPGDIHFYSPMPLNLEMADHCCFSFNKSFFYFVGSSHQLTFVTSFPLSLCASLDMAPGEFSGVYLHYLSVCSPFFPSVGSGWMGRILGQPCCSLPPPDSGRGH